MGAWLRRLFVLINRRSVERELDEELRFHQDMKQEALEGDGLAPELARDAARRAIGGASLRFREQARDVWMAPRVDAMLQDVRHAVRLLRRNPAFAFTAIAIIALGIGLNTAIFSMVYGVLIKPLRYRDPARLVVALPGQPDPRAGERIGLTWQEPEYHALADSNQTLEGLAALSGLNRQLTGQGEPEQLWGLEVSANFLDVLGVAPTLGHDFVQGDAAANAGSVLIGDGLWHRAFGGDPQVIGRVITLDGEPKTIVGVLPAGFSLRLPMAIPNGIDLLAANEWRDPHQNNYFLVLVGRLKPGVTAPQVDADLTAIRQGRAKTLANPAGTQSRFARVVDLQTQMVGVSARRLLLVLAGAVLLVLLIVAVNIANLQLARWSSRRLELSLRMALGAGRRRIIGQLLTESLVLALAGGILGIAIAYLAVPLLLAALPPGQMPRIGEIQVNTPVLAFSLLLAVGTGVIFGLLPALRHTTLAGTGADDLRGGASGGRAATSGRQTERLRGLLVIGQVALTLILLISAGLLMHSFVRLLAVPPGFDVDDVLTMTLVLPERQFATTAQTAALTRDVLDRLAQMPNASATSAVSMVPLGIFSIRGDFEVEGQPTPNLMVAKPKTAPNYFRALGIPLLAGRDFQPGDTAGAPKVAIVSESVARRLWPDGNGNANAIGKRLRLDGPDWSTVVGVVGDVHQTSLTEPPQPAIYIPYTQEGQRVMLSFISFVARTTTPQASAAFMRQALREAAPSLPVVQVKTMQTLRSEVIAEPRTRAALLGGFALCALTIASLGIYGVMTYAVTQRRREIGIRMAIGAEGRDVVWLVLRRALLMVTAGALAGLAASFAVTNTLTSFLFEVQPHDPITIVSVTLVLAAVAMTAAWLPARHAARTDPVDALRSE